VHAGLAIHPRADLCPWPHASDALPIGAVIGVVVVTDEVEAGGLDPDPWVLGPWCLVLGERMALDPIPARGWLGLWRVSDDVESEIMQQLRRAGVSPGLRDLALTTACSPSRSRADPVSSVR
jgi:hypothetical protein